MSLWDNVKKFAQPYTDDDYDDYDEDEEYADDDYEEPEEKPARRSAPARRSRPAAPVEDEPEDEYDGNDFGFGSIALPDLPLPVLLPAASTAPFSTPPAPPTSRKWFCSVPATSTTPPKPLTICATGRPSSSIWKMWIRPWPAGWWISCPAAYTLWTAM